MRKLLYRSFLLGALVTGTFIIFMYVSDPYVLVKSESEGKKLPYNPMYNYNFLRHQSSIDFGFLGSSAVNYLPLELYRSAPSKGYSMGIEGSNIFEQIAYGSVLATKGPSEIVFFITFYALNPARGNQNYFHPTLVKYNSLTLNFINQYFNAGALNDAIEYLGKRKEGFENWHREFNQDGSRTQYSQLSETNYDFNKQFSDYLSYMFLDPRYYNSQAFKDTVLVSKGIKALKTFYDDMTAKGIKVTFATAPEHRLNMALVYKMGLGSTYEYFRRQLAFIAPFYDLNADTAFTSKQLNFWDTHHARRGGEVMKDFNSNYFLVSTATVNNFLSVIRPNENELQELNQLFAKYKDWDKTKEKLKKDLAITPPIAP